MGAVAEARLGRRGSVVSDARGAVARLLIRSCGIPAELPSEFNHLQRRRAAFGKPDWAGPEVIFEIRNKLVHPPSKLDKPEWPESACLLEAWQLSTWYLELILLHTLGYRSDNSSRLRLARDVWDVVLVPWTSATAVDADLDEDTLRSAATGTRDSL